MSYKRPKSSNRGRKKRNSISSEQELNSDRKLADKAVNTDLASSESTLEQKDRETKRQRTSEAEANVKSSTAEVRPVSAPIQLSPAVGFLDADTDDDEGDKGSSQAKVRQVSARGENSQVTLLGVRPINGELKQRTTKDVLQEAKDKRVRIVQFGGGKGSTAGDAALISLKMSRRRGVVDVGGQEFQWKALLSEVKEVGKGDPSNSEASEADTASDSEEDNTKAEATEEKNSKQFVYITHWHEDHAGPPSMWGGKTGLVNTLHNPPKTTQAPTLFYNRAATARYQDPVKPLAPVQVTRNGQQIFKWKTKPGKSRQDSVGDLRVQGWAILPPAVEPAKKASNTESLGVLTTVEKTTTDKDKNERLFTMVSLGDMDGLKTEGKQEVANRIKEVQTQYCTGVPIDVVKIPHHGSENNLPVIPPGLITEHTTVVISGYTKTAPSKLIEAIKEWKPKAVVLLVGDQSTLGELMNMGMSWTNLEKVVTVAKDLVMTVGDDGKVSIEATKLE